MVEARSLKQREYNTNVFAHDQTSTSINLDNVRDTNTFKSTSFIYEPDVRKAVKYTQQRQNTLQERPLTAQVTTASYQDSNIFGYKSNMTSDPRYQETIQKSAGQDLKNINERDHNTWKSSVLNGNSNTFAAGSASRFQQTYQSSVFAQPQLNGSKFTKMGTGDSHGTAALFGSDPNTYHSSSVNTMISVPQENFGDRIANERMPKSAVEPIDAKARELYGQTLEKYNVKKDSKTDGAIMAQGCNWLNPGHKAIDTESTLQKTSTDLCSKGRKYQNLQSSVFGGGYNEGEPVQYDKDVSKAGYGALADWTTQAGMGKPQNAINSQDPFRERQKNLTSSILPQTDQSHHLPISRDQIAKRQDNTMAPEAVFAYSKPLGRKGDQILVEGASRQEPQNQNYDSKALAKKTLQGAYQPSAEMDLPAPVKNNNENSKEAFNFSGRETKATQQTMLASNDFITGESSMLHYYNTKEENVLLVDFVITGLPADSKAEDLKTISGSKHVISSVVETDNFKGICTGQGRIQLRLSHSETAEQVKLNFVRLGLKVRDFTVDTRKRPTVTGTLKEPIRERVDHKFEAQNFLQTQNPDMFGTSTKYYPESRK